MAVASEVRVTVCDSCGHEAWGETRPVLLEAGWKFHDAKRCRAFIMCGDCEQKFAARREAT